MHARDSGLRRYRHGPMSTANPLIQPHGATTEPGPLESHVAPPLLATPLYGRSREIQALSMAYRRAAAGSAELVVLSGPAGIGKTTLVQQMHTPLGQQRGYFISGKFDQQQRDVPFTAIV